MKNNITRLVLIFLIGLWIFGFSFHSFFPESSVAASVKPIAKKFYSTVCHQNKTKLCKINGKLFLVCPRCTGIYTGILTGIILSFVIIAPIKLKFLVVTAFFVLLDVILSTFEVYYYSKIIAFITGLFFGTFLFLYIQDVVFKIFIRKD